MVRENCKEMIEKYLSKNNQIALRFAWPSATVCPAVQQGRQTFEFWRHSL